ncbi:unnamed protein product [Rhizophagus irregularis]|nr:unnamed protein product [Rhizophagus irregularis]CAB5363282.1 unnamed protein product [Rhizophagus irregularis]
MADTLEKSENDKISGLSDILSVDTLSLDAQSFKTVSTKNILDIDIIFTSAEEKPSYDKKLKKFFISIVDKITNPSDLIKEVKNDIKKWKSKDKKRKSKNRLNDFLGYYECLNTSELLNPKISLFTARIDLHGENVDEAKNLIITKIKNTPYVENASIFVIPGVGNHMNSTNNPGVLNESFPVWIKDDSIKNLIDGEPVKGEGTYEIFIKKINNNNNNSSSSVIIENETINEWKEYAENGDIKYMMALAGYYMMKRPKENHREAESWYKEAEKLGSYEAKLCLGYMYSIAL